VAWPLILVEGEEKAGKSVATYSLSRSPHVGRTFVFDLGEGTADEYAELGPYEVVEHAGTFTDLLDQLRAACAIPAVDGKPNVIIIDDASALWALLKDWASARARQSRAGKRTLAADPDAEVDVSMNLWNDAKDRWNQIVNLLRTWPGIGLVIAKGREVSKVAGGVPVAGQTEWSVDVQKTTPAAVSAWVRMRRPHTATLIGVRSLHVEVPNGGLLLPADNPLEHLIFELLGGGTGFTESLRIMPSLADMTPEDRGETPDPEAQAKAGGWDGLAQQAEAWNAVLAGVDTVVLRRLKRWKADHAKGSTVAAHTATVHARAWFAAHRQAQVARGEDPFDTEVEVEGSDGEAVDGYVRSLAEEAPDGAAAHPEQDRAGNGQQDTDPGRPFGEGD